MEKHSFIKIGEGSQHEHKSTSIYFFPWSGRFKCMPCYLLQEWWKRSLILERCRFQWATLDDQFVLLFIVASYTDFIVFDFWDGIFQSWKITTRRKLNLGLLSHILAVLEDSQIGGKVRGCTLLVHFWLNFGWRGLNDCNWPYEFLVVGSSKPFGLLKFSWIFGSDGMNFLIKTKFLLPFSILWCTNGTNEKGIVKTLKTDVNVLLRGSYSGDSSLIEKNRCKLKGDFIQGPGSFYGVQIELMKRT